MKTFEVVILVYNNQLKQRREELGYTQAQMAEAIGVPLGMYGDLEGLRVSPLTSTGEWRSTAREIANFHCVEVEELFPDAVREVEHNVARLRLEPNELAEALHGDRLAAAALPELAIEQAQAEERLRLAIGKLRPREREVLRRRFGLDGFAPQTCEEVASALDVCAQRVRQIEVKALRTLRRPAQSKEIAVAIMGRVPPLATSDPREVEIDGACTCKTSWQTCEYCAWGRDRSRCPSLSMLPPGSPAYGLKPASKAVPPKEPWEPKGHWKPLSQLMPMPTLYQRWKALMDAGRPLMAATFYEAHAADIDAQRPR